MLALGGLCGFEQVFVAPDEVTLPVDLADALLELEELGELVVLFGQVRAFCALGLDQLLRFGADFVPGLDFPPVDLVVLLHRFLEDLALEALAVFADALAGLPLASLGRVDLALGELLHLLSELVSADFGLFARLEALVELAVDEAFGLGEGAWALFDDEFRREALDGEHDGLFCGFSDFLVD